MLAICKSSMASISMCLARLDLQDAAKWHCESRDWRMKCCHVGNILALGFGIGPTLFAINAPLPWPVKALPACRELRVKKMPKRPSEAVKMRQAACCSKAPPWMGPMGCAANTCPSTAAMGLEKCRTGPICHTIEVAICNPRHAKVYFNMNSIQLSKLHVT